MMLVHDVKWEGFFFDTPNCIMFSMNELFVFHIIGGLGMVRVIKVWGPHFCLMMNSAMIGDAVRSSCREFSIGSFLMVSKSSSKRKSDGLILISIKSFSIWGNLVLHETIKHKYRNEEKKNKIFKIKTYFFSEREREKTRKKRLEQ